MIMFCANCRRGSEAFCVMRHSASDLDVIIVIIRRIIFIIVNYVVLDR